MKALTTTAALFTFLPFSLIAEEAAPPSVAEPTTAKTQTADNSPDGPKGTDVSALIDWILANADNLHALPFSGIIESTTGKKILPLDPQAETDKAILDTLGKVMDATTKKLSLESSPVRGLRRINEASKFFEEEMLAQFDALPDFTCVYPPLASGSTQRSGYPDLKLTHIPSGRISYIDPKLFENKSKSSSLRTFYFEPKIKTNKVLEDAHHILVGISHDGNDGKWQFTAWHAVDLSKFNVRLKAEFQGSNKDLYREDSIVRESAETD